MECRQQRHEHRYVFAAAELLELGREFGGQSGGQPAAFVGARQWTRVIGRQFQGRGRVGELLFPVVELPFDRLFLQPASLPYGKVRVLNGHLRQHAGVQVFQIKVSQFAQQHVERPAVADDVMQREDQLVMQIRVL